MKWKTLSKRKESLHHKKYSSVLLEILKNRGFKNENEIERFLNPIYEKDLHDFSSLPDIKEFLDRTYLAIKNNEKVVIFGDFDVDGITATTLLVEALNKIGIRTGYYLPHRTEEGYGLNKKALTEISKKASLLITVDCGIRDHEAVSFAKKLGLDVIITDHHEPGENLPKGIAIVNPKVYYSKYPERNLAAVGVVFKIINAIVKDSRFQKSFKKGEEKWLLDLVALATISDSVPLLGENRVLTKYGLIVLSKTKRLGLQGLMDVSGVDRRKINSETVSFNLSPRLNVAGRLSHADQAIKLLQSSSYEEALSLAGELDKMNLERQRLTEAALKEALTYFKKDITEKVLFLSSSDWHRGIIGIIAGRVAGNFSRPAFAIEKGNKKCFGSARSFGDVNVVSLLERCSDVLLQFGGHKNAAGFSFLTKDIDIFKEKLLKEAEFLTPKDLEESIDVEMEVEGNELTFDLASDLERLEPFGEKNLEPMFLIKGVKVIDKREVGAAQNHLLLRVAPNKSSKVFKAIGFKMAEKGEKVRAGNKLDIVFKLRINEFNGFSNLDLNIVDFR